MKLLLGTLITAIALMILPMGCSKEAPKNYIEVDYDSVGNFYIDNHYADLKVIYKKEERHLINGGILHIKYERPYPKCIDKCAKAENFSECIKICNDYCLEQ